VEGAGAAWSPDGRRLAVVREFADDSENAVLDVVDVARASATTIFTSPGRGLPRGPVWSGNGRRIVFTRDFLRGDNGELWSIPSAGGQAVRLNGDGDQADVSPDGRHVIFVGGADRLLIGDRRAHHPHDLVGRRNQAWVGEGMNDPDWRR
jgi:Tol biopolymer transport system component